MSFFIETNDKINFLCLYIEGPQYCIFYFACYILTIFIDMCLDNFAKTFILFY